ncbi:MAG: hypothetical protein EZS28_024677 [Streblomastix strix]|uniref:Uncharacterized protein n=1 Tax=Streblomastix strix TaxID=222440 RepID=A0A5J4VB40_9EUKA|nr:MAG: hypothetical protein EZS28_024677 [Streblomastix strix]
MTLVNDLGQKNRKLMITFLIIHTTAALSYFSKMAKISDFLLFRNFSRCMNLNTESKARYEVIWDIERLFNYVRHAQFVIIEEKQLLAMCLLISFSTG